MYSILPLLVACLFLFYGAYVLVKQGLTAITSPLIALCLTTFFWQGTWAVLFQVQDDQALAFVLAKIGYCSIILLPTTLYHFLIAMAGRDQERGYLKLSYGICGLLIVALLGSDYFIQGVYLYHWGYYPQAAPLHALHVLQTSVVVLRGLYICYQARASAQPRQRIRLDYCIASLFIYFFAAVDYLCNYGVDIYPPGVIFLTISLGLLVRASLKYQLLDISTAISQSLIRIIFFAVLAAFYTITQLALATPLGPVTQYGLIVLGLVIACEAYIRVMDYSLSLPRHWRSAKTDYDYRELTQTLLAQINAAHGPEALLQRIAQTLEQSAFIQPVHMCVNQAVLNPETSMMQDQWQILTPHPLPTLGQSYAQLPIGVSFLTPDTPFAELFLAHEAQAVLVMQYQGRPACCIWLGSHLGHDHYAYEDLNLLDFIYQQLSDNFTRLYQYEHITRSAQRYERVASLVSVVGHYQHELKAPLDVIRMYVDADYPKEVLTAEIIQQCERFYQVSRKISGLIKGQDQTSQETVQINALITLALKVYKLRDIQLRLSLAAAPDTLQGNTDDLLIMLVNIIKNAAEAIAQGDRPGQISIHSYTTQQQIHLVIKDNGVGIAAQDLAQIWSIAYSTKIEGSGIGMSVIQRIIKDHQGQIELQSELNVGTSVQIRLPRMGAA